MKKKTGLNITMGFILVVCLVIVTATTSFLFIREKAKQYSSSPPISYEALIASTKEEAKIEKTETRDFFYYEVTDYERDLSYSWKFIKEENKEISVEDSLFIENDLRLSLNANTIDTEKIEEMVDQKKLIVSFDYHGQLPLQTSVKINVADRFKNGEKLYLYYYNPEESNIEYMMHNVVVENGHIEFQIEHCSDYFLTAAVVNDAVNNPKSINFIIIGLIAIVFILVAITLLQSKNK